MKNILLFILIFITTSACAQVIGNGEIVTKKIDIDHLKKINIQLYANITIDCKKTGIQISAESNIIDLVRFNITNDSLTINQHKWIEPTRRIEIIIGAPELTSVHLGSHEEISVINMTNPSIQLYPELGTINISGLTEDLTIYAEQGHVNASDLIAQNANINISEDGFVLANVIKEVHCDISPDGKLSFVNTPLINDNCEKQNHERDNNIDSDLEGLDVRWIDLKIKNNSWRRNHYVVIGPKPNSKNFSYGFTMMPGQTKKERWTTGTKIYAVNALKIRTLLITLDEKDNGSLVKLYQ